MSNNLYWAAAALGTTAVVFVAAPVAVPLALGIFGFGTGGIAAGSTAAAIMASYGGVVGAGSACAVAQSVGAAGILYSTALYAGGVAGAGVYAGSWLRRR